MKDFLKEIVEYKKELIGRKKESLLALKKKLGQGTYKCNQVFKKSISQKGPIHLIAEIKKASPSQGLIRKDFDLLSIAKTYEQNGAAALSILTEDKHFLGQPSYVTQVNGHVHLPLLMKDFFIDELQIYEARTLGANAILLIAAILSDDQLRQFKKAADILDMDCLFEVHDERELKRVLQAGAEMIGVNNRDLRSFEVDLTTCKKLIPLIPKDKVIVAESGIQTYKDVKRMAALGAHAVLIGETFMRAEDIASKMREVMHG